MKKKILFFVFIVAAVGVAAYFYAYQGHRDIAAETADFSLTVADLQKEFTANDSLAYRKYQDKTILVSGKSTQMDPGSKTVVIDDKLSATFAAAIPNNVKLGTAVKIKGRFLGYDDLLEEFKVDQATLTE